MKIERFSRSLPLLSVIGVLSACGYHSAKKHVGESISEVISLADEICTSPTYGKPFEGSSVLADILVTTGEQARNFEGPLWLASQQKLLFCDRPARGHEGAYNVADVSGSSYEARWPNLACGGLAISPEKDSLFVTMGRGADVPSVARIDLTSNVLTTVSTGTDNAPFGSPNDLTVTRTGIVYVSDTKRSQVYKILPSGETSVARKNLSKANGITLSLDETTLYVSGKITSTRPHSALVYAMSVENNGDLGEPRIVVQGITGYGKGGVADGMATDCAGNIYVTISGTNLVLVIDKHDKIIGQIEAFDKINPIAKNRESLTNVAFGGKDNKALFITSLTGRIYSIDLAVPGLPY